MQRVWFVRVDGQTEGPYTGLELRDDPRVSLDSLVWKAGFPDWVPLREVPTLARLFEEEPEEEEEPPKWQPSEKMRPDDVLLLLDTSPPNPTFWLLICAILLLYLVIRLYLF
ncbi:MAG: DUF4339 domain-containing protein [Chlamydiia bacterium]|nr:DUF4339 domain-containing protein [Chlamydiia bacterium]